MILLYEIIIYLSFIKLTKLEKDWAKDLIIQLMIISFFLNSNINVIFLK